MKKKICMMMSLMLFFSILTTGCKESPTLEEVRYTNDASEVDTDINDLDPEDWGDLEEQFENEQNEQSDTEREEEDDSGIEDEEKDDTDHAVDTQYRPDSFSDASGNDSAGYSTASGSGDGTSGESSPELVAGGEGTGKQIVDASGRTVTVPENVGSVSAVGAAAQMVEMLSGGGKLVAADSSFLTSSLAKSAFSDISGIASLWKGDGSDGITSTDFSKLLAAKPDVCIEISGEPTFSDAQARTLEASGIPYVVLPALSSEENLKNAVTLMGQILGGDAVSKASEYNSWVDSIKKKTSDKASDMSSLYIKDWDDDAVYNIKYALSSLGGSSGKGMALAFSPKASQLISTFMKNVGVTNESTRIKSLHKDTELVYVGPMFHYLEARVSGTMGTFYLGAGEYGTNYDLFVARQVSNSVYVQLGSSAFPAVIAADAETKSKIENNWFWQYHSVDAAGAVNLDGYDLPQVVMSPYEIYVNPSGMCSWEASVESPLESCWIAAKFSDSYSLADAKSETRSFYKNFLGVNLSDSQLASIFNE